jgi:hypothetical protein
MLQTALMGFAKGSTHPRLLICRHGKSNPGIWAAAN